MRQLWRWLLPLTLACFLGIAVTSVLAAPAPDPIVAFRAANLPEVSRREIPSGLRRAADGDIRAQSFFWLVRDGATWHAISGRSTIWLRCPVQWQANHDRFLEPCWGATYDRAGKILHGSQFGYLGLDWYPVSLTEDGLVMVDLSQPQLGKVK